FSEEETVIENPAREFPKDRVKNQVSQPKRKRQRVNSPPKNTTTLDLSEVSTVLETIVETLTATPKDQSRDVDLDFLIADGFEFPKKKQTTAQVTSLGAKTMSELGP